MVLQKSVGVKNTTGTRKKIKVTKKVKKPAKAKSKSTKKLKPPSNSSKKVKVSELCKVSGDRNVRISGAPVKISLKTAQVCS